MAALLWFNHPRHPVFPDPRAKMTQVEKAAAIAVAKAAAEQETTAEENAPVTMPEVPSELTKLKIRIPTQQIFPPFLF